MPQLTLPRIRDDLKGYLQDFLREIERWSPYVLRRSDNSVARILAATDGVSRRELGLVIVERRVTTFEDVNGASLTISNGVEQGWLVWGVFARNLTAITGPTSYDVGTASVTARWGALIGTAKADKNNSSDFAVKTLQYESMTDDVVLTANGGNFSDGDIEVVRIYSPFDF